MCRIDPSRWYTTREAESFLGVGRDTIKKYCRERKVEARQMGPRREWYIQGRGIQELRVEWGYDPLEESPDT